MVLEMFNGILIRCILGTMFCILLALPFYLIKIILPAFRKSIKSDYITSEVKK